MNITVAGTGYVGLSLAMLLSQYNDVTAIDVVHKKVELINQKVTYKGRTHREISRRKGAADYCNH